MSSESAHHSHDHAHNHGHVSGADAETYIQANRDHFNKVAQEYESFPGALEATEIIGNALLEAYPFNKDSTVMLDFACGPGLISRKLLGNAKQVVGVDISQGMVDEYNRRASLMGASTDQIQAVCYDLKGQDGELNDKRFDVIICTLAYHHFPSVQETTQKLAFFLKPGGVLLVSDFVKSDNGNMLLEHAKDKVPHKGFEESEVRELFENANLVQFNFRRGIKLNLFNADIEGFIAKGTKIADEGK